MSTKIVIRQVADDEFTEAAEWYERQQEGLGLEFIDHVQKVIDRIVENPLQYPIVHRDIREAIVSRFPFSIYYRVKTNRVVIVAVFHCSREPSRWQSRN